MSTAKDPFDALLDWLDTDRDIAARKYETIRAGLIRIFVSKGFSDAEDLADEAIRRVCKRLPDIRDSYLGDLQIIFMEWLATSFVRNIEQGKSRQMKVQWLRSR